MTTLRVTELGVAQTCNQLLPEADLVHSTLINQRIVYSRIVADITPSTEDMNLILLLRGLGIILESHLWTHLPLNSWDRIHCRVPQVILIKVVDILPEFIDLI